MTSESTETTITPDAVAAEAPRLLALLEALVDDRGLVASIPPEMWLRVTMAAGRLAHPDAKDERRLNRALRKQKAQARRAHDQTAREGTGIRAARRQAIFVTPLPEVAAPLEAPAIAGPAPEATPADAATAVAPATGAPTAALPATLPPLRKARRCYVCKTPYTELHPFYDAMCKACGDFNYAKRVQTADLTGRVALMTGGRVKIGYHAVVKLLRAGARVIVTTRFPRDGAARFAREPDFAAWADRIELYGLDLRHTPSVERLAEHLNATLPRLDFIIHNACQTVRRPPAFYAHLLASETAPLASLPAPERRLVEAYEDLRAHAAPGDRLLALGGIADPARLSQAALTPEDRALAAGPAAALFPEGHLDADLQQRDLRDMNSWRLRAHEVATVELLEVQLVNAVAPFVLSARLRALMAREKTGDKHIVNVSAMEGQFNRGLKTPYHPHTNMAKAALNMLTRTSAQDFVKDGIFMNSVDTGWVTDEDPAAFAERKAIEQGEVFQPPLDIVDGAARIVDPIFHGVRTGEHACGQFLKDYKPTPW